MLARLRKGSWLALAGLTACSASTLTPGMALSGSVLSNVERETCTRDGAGVPCAGPSDVVARTTGSSMVDVHFVLERGGGLSMTFIQGYFASFEDVCTLATTDGELASVMGGFRGLAPESAWTRDGIALVATVTGGEVIERVTGCGTADRSVVSRSTPSVEFDVDYGVGDAEHDGSVRFFSSSFDSATGWEFAGTFTPI